ncbi:hypothetical protein C8R46DRAFT_276527 [Mycena filopes]|nr:hypothetical protein C8R46DRAFT_276527 [Mycena filopes]
MPPDTMEVDEDFSVIALRLRAPLPRIPEQHHPARAPCSPARSPPPTRSPSSPSSRRSPSPSSPRSSRFSSPTLAGSSPIKKVPSILPPLQIPDRREFSASLSPLSPTPPLSPAGSRVLGKRSRPEDADEEDEDEENEEDEDEDEDEEYCHERRGRAACKQKKLKLTLTLPSVEHARRNGGVPGDGGGGGGGGGGPPAHMWTEDCVRRGDRGRIGDASSIGCVPCQAGACQGCDRDRAAAAASTSAAMGPGADTSGSSAAIPEKQTGGRKRRQDAEWVHDPDGDPPITKAAGRVLVKMAGIFNRDGRTALESILRGPPSTSVDGSIDRTDIGALVTFLKGRSDAMRLLELDLMLGLVQLALNVDSEQRRANLAAGKPITKVALAKKFTTRSVSRQVFSNWLGWGQRLLLLAGGGTLGVLVIFAALDMRTYITQPERLSNVDIVCLAGALREAHHHKWLPLVQRLMLPLNYIRTSAGYIQSLQLRFVKPLGGEQLEERIDFGVGDPLVSDAVFDDIQTNLIRPVPRGKQQQTVPSPETIPSPEDALIDFHLPVRAPAWDFSDKIILWKALLDPEETSLPFEKKTRHEWTETQRGYADKAPLATSLKDLESKLKGIHRSGTSAPGQYVELNSDTLEGNALFIRDANGKLVSLYFKIPEDYIASLKAAQDHIHAILHGEWKDEKSRAAAFKYLSLHYSWYCRFAENGDKAPKDLHPNKCRKKTVSRVNITQRVPHQTQEISQDPEEYVALADAFTGYFEIVSEAVSVFVRSITILLIMTPPSRHLPLLPVRWFCGQHFLLYMGPSRRKGP